MADKNKILKIALISGASHALAYKEKNSKATEQEILKHIAEEADNIVGKIDRK